MTPPSTLRFIDLFAGLGGFHLALASLGHKCVFASELDPSLRALYRKNFGTPAHRVQGDIRELDPSADIPDHDVLCAGFPCQPFSKAGEQQGFECKRWGDLFDFVIGTLEAKRPTYLLLENVPNITKHDDGATWAAIKRKLKALGYDLDERIISPHEFGSPQVRHRVFLVGRRGSLDGFGWPDPPGHRPSLGRVLSRRRSFPQSGPDAPRTIPPHYLDCFEVWNDFLGHYPKDRRLPSFPIWAMEFGATYPLSGKAPFKLLQEPEGRARLAASTGSFGEPLGDKTDEEILAALPPYARYDEEALPPWKVRFIEQNRGLYALMQPWIDQGWLDAIQEYVPSLQKLEWNYKGSPTRSLWDNYVIQIRASGIRVKRPDTAPSLVAMTTTQIPIVGRTRATKRYMTMRECARLQDMRDLKHLPPTDNSAFKALGNAVNVKLVRAIADRLLSSKNGSATPSEATALPPASGDGSVGDAPEFRIRKGALPGDQITLECN